MSDFPVDSISGAEYERQLAMYRPFTEAVRKLIDAGIRTGVDEATIAEAQAAIEAVTERLTAVQRVTTSTLRHEETGRPLAYTNPAVGVRNAISPPMEVIHEDGEGEGRRCWAEFELGLPYEGPPGLVHGGICALVLDHILGEAASDGLTKPHFTGTITLRYVRGTKQGPVRAEAWIDRVDGVKTFARGTLSDVDGVSVEADGIFIRPSWARE